MVHQRQKQLRNGFSADVLGLRMFAPHAASLVPPPHCCSHPHPAAFCLPPRKDLLPSDLTGGLTAPPFLQRSADIDLPSPQSFLLSRAGQSVTPPPPASLPSRVITLSLFQGLLFLCPLHSDTFHLIAVCQLPPILCLFPVTKAVPFSLLFHAPMATSAS